MIDDLTLDNARRRYNLIMEADFLSTEDKKELKELNKLFEGEE